VSLALAAAAARAPRASTSSSPPPPRRPRHPPPPTCPQTPHHAQHKRRSRNGRSNDREKGDASEILRSSPRRDSAVAARACAADVCCARRTRCRCQAPPSSWREELSEGIILNPGLTFVVPRHAAPCRWPNCFLHAPPWLSRARRSSSTLPRFKLAHLQGHRPQDGDLEHRVIVCIVASVHADAYCAALQLGNLSPMAISLIAHATPRRDRALLLGVEDMLNRQQSEVIFEKSFGLANFQK